MCFAQGHNELNAVVPVRLKLESLGLESSTPALSPCASVFFHYNCPYTYESRQQTIDYGHGTSILSFIKSGVPQGSILGPLLFLLFINDLPLLLKHCFSDFFADDSTIHSSAPSIAKVNKELQAGLKIAVAWSKQNKLPINYDKTTYMLLGTKPKEHDTYLFD